ncbi:30S ribosomal protein S17 [[Mycoplasma] gypis]|uniref:Small ribosomal subunit protein uS17 n=1 Tax=[Mycoplasma] gypis TaxID=92404 RepID=A0ABZ2RPU9_9BACT|nr:30S ribosomal protein S17 [[Mycoplasma] gypis]MBN0919177.1 30S ribosomal protein S17 [[Mycoplasma] gypis]
MERTNNRKVLTGKVVSNKNDKTVIVLVETYVKHPIYQKRYKKSKRFAVHDELNQANLNDIVIIQETRPLSKTKHFRLVSIKEKALVGEN